MKTYLFACVHNAGRSQMSAAWFNVLADPSKARAISAGTKPGERVHPAVVEAMREVGIDLADMKPQRLTPELAAEAVLLVTMGCGDECPHVPGLRRDDWPLSDPKGQPVERVRAIRDDIRRRVEALVENEGVARQSTTNQENAMPMKVEVYDPAMCCPTGVCGPSVDPVLPKFAADLDWLKGQGIAVERYNLSQQPAAFAESAIVKQALAERGTECLPLVLLDGRIIAEGQYPNRATLAALTGVQAPAPEVKKTGCTPKTNADGSTTKCC
jgi:arsenate reductase